MLLPVATTTAATWTSSLATQPVKGTPGESPGVPLRNDQSGRPCGRGRRRRQRNRLAKVERKGASAAIGNIDFVLTITDYDAPVTIAAPAPSEVSAMT